MSKASEQIAALVIASAMAIRCPQCGAGPGKGCGASGLHKRRVAKGLKGKKR